MDQEPTDSAPRRLERQLDLLTLVVLVLAAGAALRHFLPDEQPTLPGDVPDARNIERRLIGWSVEPVLLTRQGDSVQRVQVFRSDTLQLLVLYRSDCPACRRTAPVWVSLAWGLDPRIAVHAITSDSVGVWPDLVSHPRVRVWHASAEILARTFRTSLVPVTMILSSDGMVRYARVGMLSVGAVDTLRQLLVLNASSAVAP